MPTHKLQFQDVSGKTTTFVDPLNINNSFVHKSERVTKNIAQLGRQPFYRCEFAQVRQYDMPSCAPNSCGIKDESHSRVILSGVNSEEVTRNWADLKANVDASIALGVLNGLRLPLATTTLVVTDPVVVP